MKGLKREVMKSEDMKTERLQIEGFKREGRSEREEGRVGLKSDEFKSGMFGK